MSARFTCVLRNRRPDGLCPDPAHQWGEGRGVSLPRLPSICQTTGLIIDPKTAFNSPMFDLAEYIAECYVEVTDDVTGRVKVNIVYSLSLLASPGKAAITNWNKSRWNGIDRVWDASNYPGKHLVTSPSHCKKSSNLKFRAWVVRCVFKCQFSLRTQKGPRILFERPEWDKIWTCEIADLRN